jgi:hypothetical protein
LWPIAVEQVRMQAMLDSRVGLAWKLSRLELLLSSTFARGLGASGGLL